MNEDRIKSLCISVLKNDGQPRLFRIADLVDDIFIPYNIDYTLIRDGINTNLIFRPDSDTHPVGTISMWEWHSPDNVLQYSYKISEKNSWIEYIRLPNISSLEELRATFHDGFDFKFSQEHNYLIEFFNSDENVCKCVFCEYRDFIFRNNKYVLRDNLYHLDCFDIPKQEIFEIKTNLLPNINKWYYSNVYLPEKTSSVLIKPPAETAKKAILKRIQRCTEGFSKEDKQVISNFVRSVSAENIINQVAIECQCSKDEASEYINEFIAVCKNYFVEQDITDSMLTRLIESNSKIANKFELIIKSRWETANAQRIATAEREKKSAERELSLIQKQINSLRNKCAESEKNIKEIEAKTAEVEDLYAQKITLADDIAEKIRRKMADAQNDLSSFFSEYAMFTGKSVPMYNNFDEKYILHNGEALDIEPEQLAEVNDAVIALKENLELIGIEKTMCNALAAYLLAAYYTGTPLILAGYGADNIVDAVSATLYNKTSDKLYLFQDTFSYDITQCTMLAVHGGFQHMNIVLHDLNNVYPYFISQTSEELLLEPRSIYNYALPLFTEYFLTENTYEQLYGSLSNLRMDFSNLKIRNISLPEYIVPPLAHKNLCTLIACSKKLYDGLSEMDIQLLTTLPVMCSLGKTDDLDEVITSLKLSDKDKSKLFTYIGEKR